MQASILNCHPTLMAHKSSHHIFYLLNFNDLKLILIVILKTAAKIQKKVDMRVFFYTFWMELE